MFTSGTAIKKASAQASSEEVRHSKPAKASNGPTGIEKVVKMPNAAQERKLFHWLIAKVTCTTSSSKRISISRQQSLSFARSGSVLYLKKISMVYREIHLPRTPKRTKGSGNK
ncbi:hypothetical protein Poly59_26650 [Rubripirellula reticaptiva]|uniref:Uncharacterized protein n=1 Tax=Rubripirellula reticaptiva TaxID=2528013 RepID=A0A5C6F9Z3_9BACT|nr:hypothetical protein Poly59_26650 [Rubripirellula reticaptiva]